MKLNGKLFGLVAVGLALGGCSTNFLDSTPRSKGPLVGMVYDRNRQTVPGAQIQVRFTPEGAPQTTQTDINGRFSLPEAPYGPLTVVITKPLHEVLTLNFSFTTQSQVLYAQILHRDSLLDLGTEAYKAGEWDKAEGYLARALALDPQYPDSHFLRAYLEIKRQKITEAIQTLNDLAQRVPSPYAVYLILADLYEFKLKDKPQAVKALQEALKIRFQPEWEERIKELSREGR